MIVQALHVLQEEDGYLTKDRLRAFSKLSGVPLYRLQEVASFFPHFRQEPTPAVEVLVCHDMACHLRGSNALRHDLEKRCEGQGNSEKVHVRPASCLGRCDRAPAALVNDHLFAGCTVEMLSKAIQSTAAATTPQERAKVLRELAAPQLDSAYPVKTVVPWAIDPYEGDSAWKPYDAVNKLVEELRRRGEVPLSARRPMPGEKDPDALPASMPLLRELREANLRGMGGAGQPAYIKWRDVWREAVPEKYIVCNADESEPATFKDRELLLRKPHLVLEGVILAGVLTDATRGFIYIRHEYPEQIERMRAEIARAERDGFCGTDARALGGRSFPVEVFVSPGGYICGEASALLEAMEDRRAEPRNKPPAPEANGLYGKPTIVNNVETLAWVPAIYLHPPLAGGDKPRNWYLNPTDGYTRGRRFFSVSGDVNRPGVYEVPCGITVGKFLIEYAQGVRGELKAFAPSGPSGGFLPALVPIADVRAALKAKKRIPSEELALQFLDRPPNAGRDAIPVTELELDLDLFAGLGFMLGAGLTVYAAGADMVDHALNCLEFFRNESCGKCVPCRVGSHKLAEFTAALRQRTYVGRGTAEELFAPFVALGDVLKNTSICGLGTSVPNPLLTVLRYFRADWERYLQPSAGGARQS
jgi:NADH:ubiquinone oxidoreductase subunit F (NADH-binding)/NADH:ubiquinone oxidoreductase subunit E